MAFTVERACDWVAASHRRGRLAHALLVTGAPGSGKERAAATIVQMLADGGVATEPTADLWGDAPVAAAEPPPLDALAGPAVRVVRPAMKSRQIGIGTIRDLERSFQVAVADGCWKVGVIVDADRMSVEAGNAFLKTLEEPPPRSLILLLTALPEALLPTIRSRCLKLPLLSCRISPDHHGRRLLAILRDLGSRALGSPRGALTLQAAVAGLLAELRVGFEDAAAATLKADHQHFAQTTDAGKWLERREKELDAGARSGYLLARQQILDLLAAWLGDVLRQKAGGAELDFPSEAAVTGPLAAAHDWPELLRRAEAFEELRRSLNTNAQEQLALEVGFLRIFG